MIDPEPDGLPCPFCGITNDQHTVSCPVLVWDDSDEPSDGMTPPDDDGSPIPNDGVSGDLFDAFVSGPPDIIPTDAMLDAEFRALEDTRPDPNQDGA